MRRLFWLSPLLALLFAAACAPSTPNVQEPTLAPIAMPSPSPVPAQKPLSFAPATYRDDVNGIELDYPSGWSVSPNAQVGSRGSQAQLFSPGTTAEQLASGGSRVSITIFDWDPKNDLAAFVSQRRLGWDSGGTKIISEATGDLQDGRTAMDFVLEGPDGVRAYFLFTQLGDRYLQIAGEGDLTLVAEIANTFRPVGYRP